MGIKRLFLLGFLFVCSVVCQAGYSVLSSTYYAKGMVGDQIIYEYTSATSPVGGSFVGNGSNNFNSWASSGTLGEGRPTGFSCSSEIYFPDEPDETVNGETFLATASCTILFQPHGNEIEIYSEGGIWESYSEPDYAGGWMQITDMTSGSVIYSFGAFQSVGWDTCPINPDHIYELFIQFGTGGNLPILYNGGYIGTDFIVTPEPASLLLFALGGLAFRVKRRD